MHFDDKIVIFSLYTFPSNIYKYKWNTEANWLYGDSYFIRLYNTLKIILNSWSYLVVIVVYIYKGNYFVYHQLTLFFRFIFLENNVKSRCNVDIESWLLWFNHEHHLWENLYQQLSFVNCVCALNNYILLINLEYTILWPLSW